MLNNVTSNSGGNNPVVIFVMSDDEIARLILGTMWESLRDLGEE